MLARHRVVAAKLAGAVVVTTLLVVSTWTQAASAHAQLESSTPRPGSVVATSPAQVVLRFDEPVEIDFGSIRVFDAAGAREDAGGTHHLASGANTVAIDLPPLPDGTYVVAWRVISDDSHPVHGAFVFSVGTSSGLAAASALALALASESGYQSVGTAYFVVRALGFAGLLGLVGTAAISLCVLSLVSPTKRVRRALWTFWLLLLAATIAGVAIQGVYAAALPLRDVVRLGLWREVLATRFGEVEGLRLALLVITAPVLLRVFRSRPRAQKVGMPTLTACGVLAVGLLATPGLAGHATSGSAVAAGFVLDLVHLGSGSIWIGSLVVLVCLLAPGDEGNAATSIAAGARRISSIALVAAGVVIVSGILQAVRQVGTLGALTDTDYGQLLLIKISIVAVLVALGALSRRLLRRETTLDADCPVDVVRSTSLLRSVIAELFVVAAVLGVTAGLVNAAPAREQANAPYTQSFTAVGVQVNVVLSPALAGATNTLHIYVLSSTTGLPQPVPEVDASLTFPPGHVGPTPIALSLAGIGHYRSRDVTFSAPGAWVLTVTVRTSPTTKRVTPLALQVR